MKKTFMNKNILDSCINYQVYFSKIKSFESTNFVVSRQKLLAELPSLKLHIRHEKLLILWLFQKYSIPSEQQHACPIIHVALSDYYTMYLLSISFLELKKIPILHDTLTSYQINIVSFLQKKIIRIRGTIYVLYW